MKALWLTFIFLSTLIVLLLVNQYFFCPRFRFFDSTPFNGNSIYNPYKLTKSDHWIKCNFHAHARSWNGVTNGHGTANEVHSAYKALKYGVHCVSNYQNIDTSGISDKSYISAYEHGFNIRKTHQLVLGSTRVQWLDYLFPQTIHNKQDILNHLFSNHSVTIINHPELRKGYLDDDFQSLAGYDCMEVLNPSVISTNQWDAALSSGKRVFIVGNDDLHNVISKDRLGKMCTFVNVRENNKDLVLEALKSGNSYGVVVGDNQHIDSIPYLKSLQVLGDTIEISVNQPAAKINITGQYGTEITSFTNLGKVKFILNKKDHYARATFIYNNGTMLFLNPVFYTDNLNTNRVIVPESFLDTMLFRALGVVVLFVWLFLMSKVLSWQKTGSHARQWNS